MNQIEELQQQIRARMDQLAAADPVCNRILGRLDVLTSQEEETNEPPELSVEGE